MANASYEIIVDTSKALTSINGLKTALAGLATGQAAAGIAQIMDNATNLSNRLNMVTQTGQSTQQAFDLMSKSALTLGVPLKDVGNLFFRIANNTKDLGLTQKEQLRVTELLNKSFQTTGATAGEAASASLQFSQALAAGTLRGDELNSILENAPGLAQALATSLGVTTGALKEMGKAGELTADKVIKGFMEGGAKIDSDFAKRLPTIDQSLTQISTTFDILVAQFDKATGASSVLAAALIEIAITMVELRNAFTGQGGGPFSEFVDNVKEAWSWVKALGAILLFVYAPFRLVGGAFALITEGTALARAGVVGFSEVMARAPSLSQKVAAAFGYIGDAIFPRLAAAFTALGERFGVSINYIMRGVLYLQATFVSFFAGIKAFTHANELFDWVGGFFNKEKIKKEAQDAADAFRGPLLPGDQKSPSFIGPPKPEEETRLQHLQKLLGIDVAQALDTATEKTGGLTAAEVKLQNAVKGSTDALKKQYDSLHSTLVKDTATIGSSPEAAEYAKSRLDALNKYDDAVTAFKEKQKQNNVSDDSPVVIEGLKKLAEARDAGMKQLEEDTAKKVAATRANDQLKFSLGEMYKQQDAINKINQDTANVGLPLVQQQYNNIRNAANAAADAQMRSVAAQRGITVEQLPQSDRQAIIDATTASLTKQMDAQDALNKKIAENNIIQTTQKHDVDTQKELRKIQDDINRTTMPQAKRAYYDLSEAADQAARSEIAAEAARRGIKTLPVEEAKQYFELNARGLDELIAKTKELQAAQDEQTRKAFVNSQQYAAIDKIRAIQDDIAKSGMTEIEKKYYDIDAAARQSAESELRALAARKNISREQLDASTVAEYYKAAAVGSDELKRATEAGYNNSRTFATGWKQALNSYTDDATNAAKQAQDIFKTTTKGMEDMIVNFAVKGKFEWKSFLATVVEELLRSQITVLFSNILNGGSSGGGGILDSIMGLFGMGGSGGSSGIGGSGQAMGTRSNPVYTILTNGSGSNALSQQGSNNTSALGNIVKGVTKAASGSSLWGDFTSGLSNFFTGNSGASAKDASYGVMQSDQNSGSSFLDDVGSFVSDLWPFAVGGNLPTGKWGIAGEKGPELIRGPAAITSTSQTAAEMGGTNVTYNINAVDAASFKAMIAADPSFIYAVSQQGARSTPMRRG